MYTFRRNILYPVNWTVAWENSYRHPHIMDSRKLRIPHTLDSEKTGEV